MKPHGLVSILLSTSFCYRLFRSQVSSYGSLLPIRLLFGASSRRFWPLTRLKPEKRRKMRKRACFLNSIGKQQSMLIAGLQTQPGVLDNCRKQSHMAKRLWKWRRNRKIQTACFALLIHLSSHIDQVRNFDKARELIEKGVAVVKGLPPNTDPRAYWEGELYRHLGSDLVRRREYEKAIDLLSLSVYLQQNYLATVEKSCLVKCE